MNINIKFLCCGAAVWLFPQYAVGQCAVTDCLQLGYTSLKSCDGGVKCPFGEYWACPKVEEKAVLGECTGYAKNCSIGQILNSDGTCTTDKVTGKTPIAVVIYISDDKKCGQAMSLIPIRMKPWAYSHGSNPDVPVLNNYYYYVDAFTDKDSCGSTKLLKNYDTTKNYKALWAALEYFPASAPETLGKWCLPAAGVLHNIYSNITVINNGLAKSGGEVLQNDNERIWSITEKDGEDVWVFSIGASEAEEGLLANSKYGSDFYRSTRPVIEF